MNDNVYSEVYDIVEHLEPELYKKIPLQVIEGLRLHMNEDYGSYIDYSKSINEQKISNDAKVLLALIYREFICDRNLKMKLRKYDYNYIKKGFDYQNLFNKADSTCLGNVMYKSSEELNDKNIFIVKYRESLLKKIIKRIKNFFQLY